MRDLAQVLAHVHDAKIVIGEGPEPPAREGPVNWGSLDFRGPSPLREH
jgi:hypothetical protein